MSFPSFKWRVTAQTHGGPCRLSDTQSHPGTNRAPAATGEAARHRWGSQSSRRTSVRKLDTTESSSCLRTDITINTKAAFPGTFQEHGHVVPPGDNLRWTDACGCWSSYLCKNPPGVTHTHTLSFSLIKLKPGVNAHTENKVKITHVAVLHPLVSTSAPYMSLRVTQFNK